MRCDPDRTYPSSEKIRVILVNKTFSFTQFFFLLLALSDVIQRGFTLYGHVRQRERKEQPIRRVALKKEEQTPLGNRK